MKVISLINMKGGVAKTTMTINLAECLSNRHNKKVLVIDIDPQFNATQCLMKPDTYIAHLKNHNDTITSIFENPVRNIASSVASPEQQKLKPLSEIKPINVGCFDLLPGNLDLFRLEMTPGGGKENKLKLYLNEIKSSYDYVLVDTPPTPSVWMTSALIASDYYLIPSKADPLSLTGIDLLKNIIQERSDNYALSIKCAGLVLTITEDNTVVFNNAYRNLQNDRNWKKYLYKYHLPKRTIIARNQINGAHILSSDDSAAKLSLTNITTEFLARIS